MFDRFSRPYSCERQDEFIYHLIAKHLKEPGTFLDIACADPRNGSNTYLLERDNKWNGIGFDIGDVEADANWSQYRSAIFIQVDATSKALTHALNTHVDDKLVDYISLDVDWFPHNYVDQVLPRILNADIRFKAMTLEHEYYKHGDSIATSTRELLHARGYKMLFQDVCFENGDSFEDWWVKPELLPYPEIMEASASGLCYHECIERVQNFMPHGEE
jgi:hypothetical protein